MSAVKLSERYITGRFLPDKAIDVLDEAGARARIDALERPPEIEEISKEIEEVCALKDEAISKQDFEEAAKHRDNEKQLRTKRDETLEAWKKSREEQKIVVGDDEMLEVVSDWTGFLLTAWRRRKTPSFLN